MDVSVFVDALNAKFFSGVPDSQLREFIDYIYSKYGVYNEKHIIAANEGNAVGIASGYYLATGKVPVVYMQNSGEGNAINPITSLLDEKVYGIPMIFVIGWRGEPGIKDEPQHIYQGEITLKLLEDIGIEYFVVRPETLPNQIFEKMSEFSKLLDQGRDVAFVISKGALLYGEKVKYTNDNFLVREEVIEHIAEAAGEDFIVSTTGKISRELFEIRERNGMSHDRDFLTVGSMGHSSSIALGIALQKTDRRIWCLDGDGALLMHLGSAAVIGRMKPKNLIHVLLNNAAHESVGGMPTVGNTTDFVSIARACGYANCYTCETLAELDKTLADSFDTGPTFVEVKCSIASRENLGRPTTSTMENKRKFMWKMEKD